MYYEARLPLNEDKRGVRIFSDIVYVFTKHLELVGYRSEMNEITGFCNIFTGSVRTKYDNTLFKDYELEVRYERSDFGKDWI